jgi:Na+/melibiose symporter-like transporter
MHAVDSRRNIFAYIFDISLFGTGFAFLPAATVIVGLAAQLTNDKALIGIAGMAFPVSWFLPQLFAAGLVRNRVRQKNFIIIPCMVGRPLFLLFALWLAVTGAASPLLTFWLLIAAIVLFSVLDAVAGVAWFDVLSRTLSPRVRARVLTFGHGLAGLLALGASELVKRILSSPDIPFPLNYAILFAGAFGFMAISTIAFFILREVPMERVEHHEESRSHIFADLRKVLAADGIFRRVIAVRLLTGMEAMAASFYLVFLKERYALGSAADGDMTQAIIAGGMFGVFFFGWLADRVTSRGVVHVSSFMLFLTPLLAALVAALDVPLSIAYGLFVAVFVMRGALDQSLVLGVLGYTMDSSPERSRAMYIGAINSVGGIVAVSPFLGGLWLDLFGRDVFQSMPYAVLFGVVTACAAVGTLISLRLPKPHRQL